MYSGHLMKSYNNYFNWTSWVGIFSIDF
jgi:hypothetical protein